jgi:hypothetical protein
MEVSFLKMFLANKLGCTVEEMSYGQTFKPMKILDQIKVAIGDMNQHYLMSPLSFDIYFETRVHLKDIVWRVFFYECGKEHEG